MSEPASACRMHFPIVLEDVKYADVVLVGRVSKYRIVRDQKFRDQMLSSPHLSADLKEIYRDPTKFLMPDYARFDVRVGEVLAGNAPKRLSVTWDNSTFGEAKTMPAGPFLMALRRPTSKIPPLRGPSATVLPSRDPKSLTILQAPCSSPFLFDSEGAEARAIRQILSARKR